MSDIQREIRALVEGFVDDLSLLMQGAIEEAAAGAAKSARKKAPRKASKKVAKKKGRKKAAKKASKKKCRKKAAKKVRKSGRRKKRTPAQLAKLEAQLLKEIKKKSGLRMEELAKVLGVGTKDLMLPAKKLLADKKVKTKGQTRATQYFAK
jgi:DNA-binding NtrC family response regulator